MFERLMPFYDADMGSAGGGDARVGNGSGGGSDGGSGRMGNHGFE